jgi:hypothetical protein
VIGSEPGFAICLAAALGVEPASLPAPVGDPAVFWRQWLAERNLGLVTVDDAASFSWPGFWIAAVERESVTGALLMFGVPSGVVLDPEGAGSEPFEIAAGAVVAPLDLQRERTRPYGEPGSATGVVEAILIGAEAEEPLVRVSEAAAVAGRGLAGDRYAAGRGTFSGRGVGGELTLIEAEALEALATDGVTIGWEEARRNVVTTGIDLNALVGLRFRIGAVECIGRRLAEPCSHLQRRAPAGVLRGLVHRGGLRADVLESGTIHVGDPVSVLATHQAAPPGAPEPLTP